MRALTAGQQEQLYEALGLIWFVKLELDNTILRLCSNAYDYPWDGFSWKGLGGVAYLETINETSRPEATALRVGLSGVPEENLSLALATPLQGRQCTVYLGLLDGETGKLVDQAVEEFQGDIDIPSIQEGEGGKSVVYITVESPFADYARPLGWRYTNDDHKSRNPGDKFFQYAAQVSEKVFIWPWRPAPT